MDFGILHSYTIKTVDDKRQNTKQKKKKSYTHIFIAERESIYTYIYTHDSMGTMFPVSAFRKIEFVFVCVYVAIRVYYCISCNWSIEFVVFFSTRCSIMSACQVVVLFLAEKNRGKLCEMGKWKEVHVAVWFQGHYDRRSYTLNAPLLLKNENFSFVSFFLLFYCKGIW